MNEKELERILHNQFMVRTGGAYSYQDILVVKELFNHLVDRESGKVKDFDLPKYKVGLMFICLNPQYWEFAKDAIIGAKQYFLPGHDVECMLWTDMEDLNKEEVFKKTGAYLAKLEMDRQKISSPNQQQADEINNYVNGVLDRAKKGVEATKDATKFETEPVEWPYPTLLRYNLFLNQEEYLKKFDYLFYCDLDMRFVNVVGDEVLSDLTAAQHPMYALHKRFWPPYEPNEKSAAYIKRPGVIIDDNGQKRFQPLYYAGGFQGGKTDKFISAMKDMKKMIDTDLNNNYIPIWNDESVWNKYLFLNQPTNILTPSYIYPDSMIREYYIPLWGQDYPPKLVTLTKKFTTSKEGAEAVKKVIDPNLIQ